MTATAFTLVSDRGHPVGVYGSRARAEAMAGQIGATIVERPVEVGSRVAFTFHSHPRVGRVVATKGARVDVEFHQNTTGKIVRSIPIHNITF